MSQALNSLPRHPALISNLIHLCALHSTQVDLFTKDLALIPINLGNSHWVCGAINFRLKRFEYYDSLGHPNETAFKVFRNYIVEEAKDKKKGDLDLTGWTNYFDPLNNPSQENGFDCGVFVSVTLEQISRRDPFTPIPDALKWEDGKLTGWENGGVDDEEDVAEWNFTQDDMPFIRRRMAYEIATKKLMD